MAEASVDWTVPSTSSPVSIYVVVDPCMILDDREWTNNSTNFAILAPDVVVDEMTVQTAGRTHMVTVRVRC